MNLIIPEYNYKNKSETTMALVDWYNQGNLVHSGKEVVSIIFALCAVRKFIAPRKSVSELEIIWQTLNAESCITDENFDESRSGR